MAVKMIRDPKQYPAPHTADVHPDEVERSEEHTSELQSQR